MLIADFTKTFPGGPTIRAGLREATESPAVTAILGSSGGGKTTILRCLAGLERPDCGSIAWDGDPWFDAGRGIAMPPERRDVGLLFQDYALFPHLTVEQNIGFALPRRSAAARVAELLERFQLTGLERRRPRQLSGGQQQRVALARAIARRPRLLLLDEPLAALDAPTRDEIRQPLRQLLAELGIPVILVTHDRLDALALARRVVIVEQGAVVQAGSITDVFAAPASARVARLVGVETVAQGIAADTTGDICTVRVGTALVRARGGVAAGTAVELCIRAEDVTLFGLEPGAASAQNRWQGRVVAVVDGGGVWRVTLDCGFMLTALVTRAAAQALGIGEGVTLWASVKATAILLLAR